MEIFGGFMVMMSILSFFMAVVWLVMPFVVFTIKGKLDRTLDVLDNVEKRLTGIEMQLAEFKNRREPETALPARGEKAEQDCSGETASGASSPLA